MKHVSRALIVVGMGIAVAACATAPSDAPVVGDIDIKGNNALSEREIKRKILTTEKPLWPFSKARPFDPADWQTDLRRIERLYETKGYYGAKVARAKVTPRRTGKDGGVVRKVDLEVEIEENDPVRITQVDVKGLDPLPDPERDALVGELPVRQDAIFREEDWAESKRSLHSELRNRGYALAQVDGHALVDVGTRAAALDLGAAPGERYFFGAVEIRPLNETHVEPAWIEEQVRLAIGWDRAYSDTALEEAQRRVFAMNVFSTARVASGDPDLSGRRMPVVVEVREGPRHTVRLGGGAAIDQSRNEARLLAEWIDRNFLGGLRRLELRALGGWAFLPDTLAVVRNSKGVVARHGPIYRLTGDLEQPRFLGRPSLEGKFQLESERTLEETFNAIGGRTLAGVRWKPHSSFTVFPSYNLQGNWMTGARHAAAVEAPLALGCSTDPCLVLLSYLEQLFTLDTRDSALEPRRGQYLALSLQEGGGPLGGDFDYLRILPEGRAYRTFGDQRFTLASRLRIGTLLTRAGADSAVTTRFYSGGSLGMRGFAMRRLSPMLLVPIDGSTAPDAQLALPIGGNGMIEGSVELRTRITESLIFATFGDFGTVTRERSPLGELGRMLWAVGIGVRYLTPVGPLRLDVAFRLPVGRPPPLYWYDPETGRIDEITYDRTDGLTRKGEEKGDHIAGGCFGIGARQSSWVRDGLCAFHLSIGEAF